MERRTARNIALGLAALGLWAVATRSPEPPIYYENSQPLNVHLPSEANPPYPDNPRLRLIASCAGQETFAGVDLPPHINVNLYFEDINASRRGLSTEFTDVSSGQTEPSWFYPTGSRDVRRFFRKFPGFFDGLNAMWLRSARPYQVTVRDEDFHSLGSLLWIRKIPFLSSIVAHTQFSKDCPAVPDDPGLDLKSLQRHLHGLDSD